MEQERREERLRLLKELMQSAGWRIYQDLLERWRGDREKVKANFLRSAKFNEAILEQGKIDGSFDLIRCLDEYMSDLTNPQETEETPSY